MQIGTVVLYSVIIFLSTLAGIYTGFCLAAKTIRENFLQDQRSMSGDDHEKSPLRRTRRRSRKSSGEPDNGPDNPDSRILRKRQDTDDSYRILKRRQKREEA